MNNTSIYFLSGGLWIVWGLYWSYASRNVNKTEQSEVRLSRLLHLGFIALTFACLYFDVGLIDKKFHHSRLISILGLVIEAAALSFSVWARLHLGKYWSGIITLKEGHKLIRTGPYTFVRHPIYTGFLFGVIGSALAVGKIKALVGICIIIYAYARKIKKEEATLTQQFGQEYEKFKTEVKALIPYVY